MNIHMNRMNELTGENGEAVGEIDIDKMKRFIAFCKAYVCYFSAFRQLIALRFSKCAPRLSPEAQEMLSSHFVALRKQIQQVERDNDERSSIPITVRCAGSRLHPLRVILINPQST